HLYATVTAGISPLPLHDALPIYSVDVNAYRRDQGDGQRDIRQHRQLPGGQPPGEQADDAWQQQVEADDAAQPADTQILPIAPQLDRKSTRLNSSHVKISYAVFCF